MKKKKRMFHDRHCRPGVVVVMSNVWLVDVKTTLEALEIWFEDCVYSHRYGHKRTDHPTTSLRGDAPSGTRWDGSQAGPDVESPQVAPSPSHLCPLGLSALDKDRPLGPLDHLVTVVMRKSASRQIHRKPRHLYSQSSNQRVYKNRAMSDKIVLAQNQNPRTPPSLHFHAFTLKCHVNLLMPGLH